MRLLSFDAVNLLQQILVFLQLFSTLMFLSRKPFCALHIKMELLHYRFVLPKNFPLC